MCDQVLVLLLFLLPSKKDLFLQGIIRKYPLSLLIIAFSQRAINVLGRMSSGFCVQNISTKYVDCESLNKYQMESQNLVV